MSAATLIAAAGSTASPSLRFNADTNTGLYQVASNQIGVVVQGSEKFRFATGDIVYCLAGTFSTSGITQTSTGVDMYLRAGTSTLIGQVNGGAQSCFRGGPTQFNVIALGVGSSVSAPTGYLWSTVSGVVNCGTTVSNTSATLNALAFSPQAAVFTSAGAAGADGLSLYRSAGWGIGFDGNGWPGVAVNNVHKLRLGTSVVIASDGFFGATSVTNTGTNNAATVTLSRYDNTTWQMGSANTANDTGGLRLTNLTSLGVLNQRLQSSTAAPNTTTLPSGATWWQDTVGNTRRFAYNDTGVIYLSPLLKSSIPSTPVVLADVIAVLQHWGLCA